MINIIKARLNHGYQAIRNIRSAVINPLFRGYPLINAVPCVSNCLNCLNQCPIGAIQKNPFTIDLGKCVFCGDCAKNCPENKIQFTNFHKTASTSREYLIIDSEKSPQIYYNQSIHVRKEIKKMFSHSLKLRQVSAGGCNACELELGACSNVNFDMGRFGIDIVASPRHADGILITGPITKNMADALKDTYLAVPAPKIIILSGSCAISGGVFKDSNALNRDFLKQYPIDLFIPGCPVHPLAVINGILDFIGRK